MNPSTKAARRVVAKLIEVAKAARFDVVKVDDGEEVVKVANAAEAMEAVFAVDECRIVFKRPEDAKSHCAVIVLGNSGWDCISDASMGPGWDDVIEAVSGWAELSEGL